MQDDKAHGEPPRGNDGIKADSTHPEFHRAASEFNFDFEERIEMAIQKRALARFKKDDDDYVATPRRQYDY